MACPQRLGGVVLLACALLGSEGPAAAEAGGALPAVGRLDLATRLSPGVVFASSAGYGYTESLLGTSDRHHRIGGTLAASVAPLDWIAVGGRLDGRYDWHLSAASGVDDGWIGDPRLFVHIAGALGRLGLAGQMSVWVPGRSAPSVVLAATSFDLRALASLRPPRSPLVFAGTLGLRLDRSARSAENADVLTDADRLSLGVGEGPSLLTGLGLTARLTPSAELLGEITWDVALDGFPRPLQSPLRIGAGARWSVTRALALQGLVEVVASKRPVLEPGGPLAPIEPRASITLTAILRSAVPAAPAGGRRLVAARPPEVAAPAAPSPPTAAAARTGAVRGRALDPDGSALPGARIQVAIGTAAPVEVLADDEGRFEATGVAEGDGTLLVAADGHDDTERPIRVAADAPAEVDVTLPRSLPRGQLRGTVTSVEGRALEARVVVQPLGLETRCGADGSFQVDVAPGRYVVQVQAPGFRQQERRVVVEDNGVTILNVDLRARR